MSRVLLYKGYALWLCTAFPTNQILIKLINFFFLNPVVIGICTEPGRTNEPAGTTVTKVTARDRDSGENAYISYSIANLHEVPFEIEHFSGLVRTSKLIDYESMRREYILYIRASDWGLPYRRQTEMELIIKIRDVNDNRPQFERIDCIKYILRHTPIGTEVFTVSAIDFDSGVCIPL
uniref:Cadherin domain-containing protein n=1 Tax=Megaselia scalaris TaxID=36166 RepID=T1GFF5_MEGSC